MTYKELRDILNGADVYEEAIVYVSDDDEEERSIAGLTHLINLTTGDEKIVISI